MKAVISSGVENALWYVGENTSWPCGTILASAISAVTLAAGRMPPCPGLAPWETLISIILTCGRVAFVRNASGSKSPLASRQPK